MWKLLGARGLSVSEYTDTTIRGEIGVNSPGIMYTSIPYSAGWSIKVNGAPAAAETVGDGALIAVRLPQGLNTVSFSYMTPGLMPGIIISICAALLLAGVRLFNSYKMRYIPVPYGNRRAHTVMPSRTCAPSNPDNTDNRPS
jgi:hypothetical protein